MAYQQPPPQGYPQYGGGPPPMAGQPMYGGPPQQVMAPPPMPMQPVGNVVPTQSFGTLAFLGSVPGMLIRQKTDWIGAVLDVAAHANRYQLKPPPMGHNPLNEPLDDHAFKALPTYFMAAEESSCCDRMCCGPYRAFNMKIVDGTGTPVLMLDRPFKCPVVCGLPPCCAYYPCPQESTLKTTEGYVLAHIRQSSRCFSCANYVDICDANDNLMFILSGYFFQFGPNCICREYVFDILTPDLEPTGGKVSNVFPGCNCRGLCTRADNLEAVFPPGATPEQRAAIVGAENDGGVNGGDVVSACL